MIWTLLELIAGILLITKGADWFTDAAVHISEATHIPRVVIGATIVSLATTMPEFAVSSYAALTDRVDFTVGNAIGSTICNIGLILGSGLLIRSMSIDRFRLTMQQGGIMIASGALMFLISLDHTISHLDSLLLLVGLVGYIAYSVLIARQEQTKARADLEQVESEISLLREIVRFVVGATCVVFGSKWLLGSAEVIALRLGVPPLVIGITLVALGTSLPEYVTVLTATIKGHQELSIGNIMGADILDILWVIGGSSLFKNLPIRRETIVLDLPVMLLLMGALTFFARTHQRLSRFEGLLLLGVYVTYLFLIFWKFGH